jgi:hypothetical protein
MAFERLASLAAFALLLIGCAQGGSLPAPQYGQTGEPYPPGTPNGQWVPPGPSQPYAPYPPNAPPVAPAPSLQLPPFPQGLPNLPLPPGMLPNMPPPPNAPNAPMTPNAPMAPVVADGQRVVVTPVFYVPSDVTLDPQTEARAAGLMATHLQIAQQRYQKLLGSDTFAYAMEQPLTYRSRLSMRELDESRPDTAHQMTSELLAWRHEDRNTSRHVFIALLVRAPGRPCGHGSHCLGGGRTFNGAPGSGGGFVQMEFNNLLDGVHFQSTLIHEIGHGMGLSHADCHGESMGTGRSIMSYNHAHWSNGFQESADPGILTDEDIVTLAKNTAAFPRLAADPSVGARLQRPLYRASGECWLGPMSPAIGPTPNFRGF